MTQTPRTLFALLAGLLMLAGVMISNWWRPTKSNMAENTSPVDFAAAVSTRTAAIQPRAAGRSASNFDMEITSLVARLRECLAETDRERQAQLEEELEALLTDANCVEILRALPSDLLATPLAEAALRRWANVDRRGAADWVAQQTGLTESQQTSVIYGWGAEDKVGLNVYLGNLPAGEWKQNAMKFAANDALDSGAAKDAIDLLAKMDRTPARNDLFSWSATAWAQSDAKTALEWANKLSEPGEKQIALGAVAVGLAWSDPATAGKLLAEQVQPGEVLNRSALGVVCVWSQTDARAAADWVIRFPEDQLRQTVLETLIQRWTAQDFKGAADWANHLASGKVREEAMRFLSVADANLNREQQVATQ